MINKILVLGGGAFALIILFTSMVSVAVPVPLLWMTTSVWMLTVISTIIGMGIGFGIRGMLDDKGNDDNYDF